jgi:hypothetical protein
MWSMCDATLDDLILRAEGAFNYGLTPEDLIAPAPNKRMGDTFRLSR